MNSAQTQSRTTVGDRAARAADPTATCVQVLEFVADNIWIAYGDCVNFHGLTYPTRSVVVRLASGELWIWSPIELTTQLQQEIDALGNVGFLVSPNKLHHLYLSQSHGAYPDALLWGPASTIKKRPDLMFESPLVEPPPEHWSSDFDQTWFNGSFMMDEIAFFHRSSRAVVVADLSENFSHRFLQQHWQRWQRIGARFWGITEGKGQAPLERRESHHGARRLATSRWPSFSRHVVLMDRINHPQQRPLSTA